MNGKETPKFSVVVPVHNKAPHVQRSVLSVLRQSLQDFELILVNDASTDGSLEEMMKFNDSRIRLLHRDRPGPGGYAARNLGIREARGEWIAFLDADDEWFPSHLANMDDLASKFPDCLCLSCAWDIVDSEGNRYRDAYSTQKYIRGEHTISLLRYLELCVKELRPVHTHVVCLRNNDFAVGLFPDGRASRGGDLHAWISYLARCKRMAWSPHVGAIYHKDSVNMVTKSAPLSTDLAKGIVRDIEPFVNQKEMKMLKKYSNRRIFSIWLNQKLSGSDPFSLSSYLFWNGDAFYCTSRSVLAFLPRQGMNFLLKLKQLIRR